MGNLKKFQVLIGLTAIAMGMNASAANNASNTVNVNFDPIYHNLTVPHLPHAASGSPGGGPQDGRKFPVLWMGSIRWEQPVESDLVESRIDGALSPVLTKLYNFQLVPQLRMPNNRNRPLEAGYYALRMVILRPEMDGDRDSKDLDIGASLYRRYVAGTERIVQLEDGAIKARIAFRFNTISATNMRNSLLIQLLEVKPSSLKRDSRGLVIENAPYELETNQNFISNVIRVGFLPRFSTGLATPPTVVYESDMNVDEQTLDLGVFIRQAERLSRMETDFISTPQKTTEVAKLLKLTHMKLNDPRIGQALNQIDNVQNRVPRISQAQLASAIESVSQEKSSVDEAVANSICRLLAVNAEFETTVLGPVAARKGMINSRRLKMFDACVSRPEDSFTLTRQVHISKISTAKSDLDYVKGASSNLGVLGNISANRSQSVDVSSGWAAGFSPLFSPIDIKGTLRLVYSYSISETKTRSRFEGMMVSQNYALEVNQWEMKFKVEAATSCLAISPRMNTNWALAKSVPGFYLCGEPVTNRPFFASENYYYVYPASASAPAVDLQHPKNQPVNMVLRGERDYLAFLTSIRSYLNPATLSELNMPQLVRNAAKVYSNSTPVIPTILSHNVSIDSPGVNQRLASFRNPSLLDRFWLRYKEKMN